MIKLKNKKGFTLIELMIALVILTILMGFAIPEVINQINQSKFETQKNNVKEIRRAIDQYYSDRGRYPKKLSDLTSTTHPYFAEIPIDPVTGTADWEVSEPGVNKNKWYRTSSMSYPNAPTQLWNPAPGSESAVYNVRPRPAQN